MDALPINSDAIVSSSGSILLYVIVGIIVCALFIFVMIKGATTDLFVAQEDDVVAAIDDEFQTLDEGDSSYMDENAINTAAMNVIRHGEQ